MFYVFRVPGPFRKGTSTSGFREVFFGTSLNFSGNNGK